MERPQTIIRRIAIRASFALVFTYMLACSSVSAQTAFHGLIYQYTQNIIAPNNSSVGTSTPIYSGIRITYDIASHTFSGGIRIVDDLGNAAPAVSITYPNSNEWSSAPIIDRFRVVGKDIMVVDMGLNTSRHSTIDIDINEDSGEGILSAFSTAEYYGIEFSTWDVLGRDITVYKNTDTGNGTFSNTTIEYPESRNRYVMLVLKSDMEKSFTIAKAYKKNPDYTDSREQFYAEAEIEEKDNKTVITIDTKSNFITHNRVDIIMYNESIMTSATIETSTDNNRWVNRGNDNIYHFLQGKKEITKTWIGYKENKDRFIKITIPEKKLLMHKLILVSGTAEFLTFNYDQNRKYTLFYGNELAAGQEWGTGDNTLSSTTKSAQETFDSMTELKVGIREDNPKYISFTQDQTTPFGLNIDYRYFNYVETVIISMIALAVLAGILKIIRL